MFFVPGAGRTSPALAPSSPEAPGGDALDPRALEALLSALGAAGGATPGAAGALPELLRRFQAAAGLPVTGQLDAATAERLVELLARAGLLPTAAQGGTPAGLSSTDPRARLDDLDPQLLIDRALRASGRSAARRAPTPGRAAPAGSVPLRQLVNPGDTRGAGAPPNRSRPTPTPGPDRAAPTGATTNVDTASMSEAQKFDHYRGLIEQSGGRFDPAGKNVVSVRTPTNTRAEGGLGRYDDVTAVLSLGPNGEKRVREFRSNTEPSARYEGRMGQDVDGNGSLDQGRLRAGHYTYDATTFRGGAAFAMRGDSTVDRDTNHDGVFGNDGGASSRGGASMLWHVGGSGMTGSAGCQTMPPDEYRRFLAELGGARSFGYTLVDRG